jgi:iron complex outermembrane receptor protein
MDKMTIKNILAILFLCLSVNVAKAQSKIQFTLLDYDNDSPIIAATYEYGNQQGVSDANGLISLSFLKGSSIKISHIQYGSWEWDENQLLEVVKKQVFRRRGTTINLYPVSIIALRTNYLSGEDISIDYQDRMQHDGAEILNQLPAFNSIRKSGNYGFDPVFRGFKYDQLNIVMDGAQSATAACPNRMDPPSSQMAPNMMESVEVLKGPHALRYGTGFGATINFVPSKMQFTKEPDIYGRLSAAYEGNGNIIRGEGQLGFSGLKYDLSFYGAWSQGDDYKDGNGDKVKAGFLRGSFGSKLGLKLSSNQQLRVSAIYNMARDVDFPALPMDLRDDDTWMFNARHEIQIHDKQLESWNTTLFASFVDHFMDNLLKPLDPRKMNAETAAKTYNYGGRTEGIWQFSKSKLFAGADLRTESAKGTRVREFLMGPNTGNVMHDNAWQNGQISKAAFFGEYHISSSSFNYIFSTRLELNQAKIKDPDPFFSELYTSTEVTQFNPNLSFGMQKQFGAKTTAGLFLGRAQRSGSLTERYINFFPVGQDPYEMLGNPELKAEANNQLDLTFEWKSKGTAINIDVFASYLQDYISSVIEPDLNPKIPSSPGVRRYINIDDAFKSGFEFNWNQQLPLGLQHQLGIAYTYAKDLERQEPLPEIPPMDFRYSLLGKYINNKLTPEIMFRYVLEQNRVSQEYGETHTPAFALLDLKLGYSISKSVKVNAMVNNVLNQAYYEHLNRSVRGTKNPIYAPGTNFFIGLTVVL